MEYLKRIDADEEQQQGIYVFSQDHNRWSRTTPTQRTLDPNLHPETITVITWNIDFASEYIKERLNCAIAHIKEAVFGCETVDTAPPPCVILLQEVHANAFTYLHGHRWLRNHFFMTPISENGWPPGVWYGNVTLVSRNVESVQSMIVKFRNSTMGRFALFVDVKVAVPHLSSQPSSSIVGEGATADEASPLHTPASAVVRFASVHLESLPVGEVSRPEQLAIVSTKLKDTASVPELRGGVVGGDMNAIGESDKGLPEKCGLLDSYTGAEDNDESFTWGYQPTHKFRPNRLDKILYTPGNGLEVLGLRRIGVGVKARVETPRAIREVWASDHYGLAAEVRFTRT